MINFRKFYQYSLYENITPDEQREVEERGLLKISDHSGGTDHPFKSLNLPAGKSCPHADKCKAFSQTDPETGKTKLVRGDKCEYSCYAANDELYKPSVRKQRQHNYDLLTKCKSN